MDGSQIEGKIVALDTYGAWKTAGAEQQHAFNAVPFEIDQNDLVQLKQQIHYLEAEEEQRSARRTLMVEVAQQDDDFLPIAYRLGFLAALEATDIRLTRKYHSDGWSSAGWDIPVIDRHEQQIRASSDPIELAVQVGDELERLRGILDTKRSVPVAMVWNYRFLPPRLDYDEVVLGELPNPRESFILEPPKLKDVDGDQGVEYSIPVRLQGVVKGEVVRNNQYVQPEEKYKDPVITTLAKLGVVHGVEPNDPDALYIGKDEVKTRVARARRDGNNYRKIIELRAARRRRRPRLRG
jgi:hypothetical protein